jgi:hypothetical protein
MIAVAGQVRCEGVRVQGQNRAGALVAMRATSTLKEGWSSALAVSSSHHCRHSDERLVKSYLQQDEKNEGREGGRRALAFVRLW